MNKRVILASLLAVSLAGCATDGYDGGYSGGYGGYGGDPYYSEPAYIAPAPVYYGGGAAYYRPGYPYRYRQGYNPHPGGNWNNPRPGGGWNGHGPKPWTGGSRPAYVQPAGRPGLQSGGQQGFRNSYRPSTPGQRPIRRYY